jgi:aldehyde:ferredoxin oxidoreductase
MEIGERIINFRGFNVRNGLKAEDDSFSPRLGTPPTEGPGAGKSLLPYIKDTLREYYKLMGWDEETGRPLPQTLKRLDCSTRTIFYSLKRRTGVTGSRRQDGKSITCLRRKPFTSI